MWVMYMGHNFKAARAHGDLLIAIYRKMNRNFEDDGTRSWWLKDQINELDQEIAAAHNAQNAKMTTVGSSGHPELHMKNIIVPIVPQWHGIEQVLKE